MTQYGPDPRNSEPVIIHTAEQVWAMASEQLDKIIAYINGIQGDLSILAAGNSDASVLFDFMKQYIQDAERDYGRIGHESTIVVCAAAITRLVRAPRTKDPLAQLDKEIDDHE